MQKKVITIGEILWDLLLGGKKPGGSSMNVALNLHKQNIGSNFISAIGDDENGKALLAFLHENNFDTSLIQVNNSFPTSTVEVKLDKNQEATYTIKQPVAWDDIKLNDGNIEAVKQADALVYCSLTCRAEQSRNTIFSLLKIAKLKIFDINLRPPFYNILTLQALLHQADILKINEDELAYLKKELALSGNDEEQILKQISNQFSISTICFTIGAKGASVLHQGQLYAHKGYPVKVADTVGAGDSFLATFTASYLQGYPMDTILDRACKVASFVASKQGANPSYGAEIFK